MKLSRHFSIALMHVAATVYEGAIGQSHLQRLARRKVSNAFGLLLLRAPKRSWEDGRTNTPKRAPVPSIEECERLNREAARSI